MNDQRQQTYVQETGDVRADIEAMIADLEAEDCPDIEWAIDEIRAVRDGLDAAERTAEWGRQRLPEWNERLMEQVARALALAAIGGRIWQPGESAADLDREAQRIRSGQAASQVPQATREREADLLEIAAELLRDRTALVEDVLAAGKTLDSHNAELAERNIARDHLLRSIARFMEDPEMLQSLNRDRRRHAGGKRGKKKG
jgi:hypothetical protein